MSNVTQILQSIEKNDTHSVESLLPLVYEELRHLAKLKMASEKPGQMLQATALVHEAFIRLVDSETRSKWMSRRHFFAAAAESMRRILIDSARERNAQKRGGGLQRRELSEVVVAGSQSLDELIDLENALVRLKQVDSVAAEIVNLRFFAGLPVPDVAHMLELSPRTVDRYWSYARAWLHQAISEEGH